LSEVNTRRACAPDPNITFGDFTKAVALTFLRKKWKRSTASTTENRIEHHLLAEFKDVKLLGLSLTTLRQFLIRKTRTLSKSVVAHLRWDLRGIFKLAVAEGYVQRDPTGAYTLPRPRSGMPAQ